MSGRSRVIQLMFVTANFSGDERYMYAPLGIYSFNSQRCQNATETGTHFTEICLVVPKSGSLYTRLPASEQGLTFVK